VLVNAAEPIDQKKQREFLDVFGEMGLSDGIMTPTWGLAESTLTVTTAGSSAVQVDKAALETGQVLILSKHRQQDRIVIKQGAVVLNRWSYVTCIIIIGVVSVCMVYNCV
jgi:hypothetical protein